MTSALADVVDRVRVTAPGKVNLSLRSGPRRDDGYHSLVTVFQAVSVLDEVSASHAQSVKVDVFGPGAELVPADATNLAVRAAQLLAQRAGISDGVHLEITKAIPVAGGMAGGSADAAAALVACDALWGTGASREDLLEMAGELGADVPFSLLGHTALGLGRGDLLSPVMTRGHFHWVFATQDRGLSTPAVFAELDRQMERTGAPALEPDPASQAPLLSALRAGDGEQLGELLTNDLQPAALALFPELRRTVDLATDLGAWGVVLSGSGPTVAVLARNPIHARTIAADLLAANAATQAVVANGPVPGARVV